MRLDEQNNGSVWRFLRVCKGIRIEYWEWDCISEAIPTLFPRFLSPVSCHLTGCVIHYSLLAQSITGLFSLEKGASFLTPPSYRILSTAASPWSPWPWSDLTWIVIAIQYALQIHPPDLFSLLLTQITLYLSYVETHWLFPIILQIRPCLCYDL